VIVFIKLVSFLIACGHTDVIDADEMREVSPSQVIVERQPQVANESVVAFSDSPIDLVSTISMDGSEEFQATFGDVVGTVEPGTPVELLGVRLGGFHNDTIAYKVSTSEGVTGFVSPENTGLLLNDEDPRSNRYVQATDLLRMSTQGCSTEGPAATVTIWTNSQVTEVSCSTLPEVLPSTRQGAVFQ